jgi:hypothetical protein
MPEQEIEQGGLAASIGPQQSIEAAGLKAQADVFKHWLLRVGETDPVQVKEVRMYCLRYIRVFAGYICLFKDMAWGIHCGCLQFVSP